MAASMLASRTPTATTSTRSRASLGRWTEVGEGRSASPCSGSWMTRVWTDRSLAGPWSCLWTRPSRMRSGFDSSSHRRRSPVTGRGGCSGILRRPSTLTSSTTTCVTARLGWRGGCGIYNTCSLSQARRSGLPMSAGSSKTSALRSTATIPTTGMSSRPRPPPQRCDGRRAWS